MRRSLLIPICIYSLTLSGCDSEGAKAERQLNMISKHATSGDMCAATQAVAKAYLNDENESKYEDWRQKAQVECAAAQLDAYSSS